MKRIIITEGQLKRILLEATKPSIKTREYWNPENKECEGCKTPNGNKSDIEKVQSGKKGDSKISLTSDSAPYYEKMVTRMNKDGLYFQSASGYRPYKTQFDIVDWDMYENSVKDSTEIIKPSNVKKIGTWKTKHEVQGKKAAVAVPGTSNHGWGHAVDVDGCTGCGYSDAQNWVRENGEVYGWTWREGKKAGENWHFKFDKSLVNDDLINLMDQIENNINDNDIFEYCRKIKSLDGKGFLLLGKSTLPHKIDKDSLREWCNNKTEIKKMELRGDWPLPVPTATKKPAIDSRAEYTNKIYTELATGDMSKKDLKQKIKQLKADGREDLIPAVKKEINEPGYTKTYLETMPNTLSQFLKLNK